MILNNTCCFSTVVYGWYQDFIPIHIYSILRSFPQHFVKIFLLDELKTSNKELLEIVRNNISDRFEIVENFTDLDWCEIPHKAALRFLLTRDYFQKFRYVYFGDIDMMTYNVFNDNFIDFYLKKCEQTELPFSNSFNYYNNRYRLTGLHFIIKDPYFDAMDEAIKNMMVPRSPDSWDGWNKCFRSQCHHNEKNPSYDEELLFHMASSVFDMRKIQSYYRPDHGWHLGDYRYHYLSNPLHKNYKLRARAKFLLNSCLQKASERWLSDKIASMIDNKIFLELCNNMQGDSKFVVDTAIRIFKRKYFL